MNFINNLPAGPSWAPWLVLGLFLAVVAAIPFFVVLTKRRDFWRDEKLTSWPGVRSRTADVWRAWRTLAPDGPDVWVYLIREGEQPKGRAGALWGEVFRPGYTAVGTTGQRLRYELGSRWLTRLLRGTGPVYEVVVREQPGDPEGARALAHELAHHVWPHLHGLGWNRAHALNAETWPLSGTLNPGEVEYCLARTLEAEPKEAA